MPTYSYHCRKCHLKYEQLRLFAEGHPHECPQCRALFGEDFNQDYTEYGNVGLNAGPKTLGQQAELNNKRLGREAYDKMLEEDAASKSKWKGPIPEGMIPKDETQAKPEVPFWRSGEDGTAKLDKPLDLGKIKDVTKYVMTGEK